MQCEMYTWKKKERNDMRSQKDNHIKSCVLSRFIRIGLLCQRSSKMVICILLYIYICTFDMCILTFPQIYSLWSSSVKLKSATLCCISLASLYLICNTGIRLITSTSINSLLTCKQSFSNLSMNKKNWNLISTKDESHHLKNYGSLSQHCVVFI